MPGASGIKAVLFDFGGVLAELRAETHLRGLLKQGMTGEQMWATWSHSPAVRAHESGHISAEEFSRRIVDELELTIPPREFLDGFREWIIGPFADTHALIRDVAARHTTALVTNTSAVHWPVKSDSRCPSAYATPASAWNPSFSPSAASSRLWINGATERLPPGVPPLARLARQLACSPSGRSGATSSSEWPGPSVAGYHASE